jgi:mercuric ion binding protein
VSQTTVEERTGQTQTLLVGGIAALLASTCCLGPLVLVALGFSGAWIGNLMVLEPYRPIFIGVALVALFLAYRRIFRPIHTRYKRANRARSARCRRPAVFTRCCSGSWLLWWWSLSVFPTSRHSSTDSEFAMKKLLAAFAFATVMTAPAWATPQTVTLSVPGMTCPACPITVKHALTQVDGVTRIDMRFERREAIVTFDNAKTTVQALTQATKNAGYPSAPVEAPSK